MEQDIQEQLRAARTDEVNIVLGIIKEIRYKLDGLPLSASIDQAYKTLKTLEEKLKERNSIRAGG